MNADHARHKTAAQRRTVAIEALRTHLDVSEAGGSAQRLKAALAAGPRGLVVGGDIDGLLSACMLASVAKSWDVVALVVDSQWLLLHPDAHTLAPDQLFGVDVFSPKFDNVGNHIVLWGSRKLAKAPKAYAAFKAWDQCVLDAAKSRLFAVPSIWARTEASRDDYASSRSSRYKYPLGSAQVLLALLESAGHGPKFFDRDFLPWLVANCDGGVRSYREYEWNVRVWWPILAAAVGPASLTELVYATVANMRPHDFSAAVNRLEREGSARSRAGEPILNDNWNLTSTDAAHLQDSIRWITELTGWRDPVRGGVDGMGNWVRVDAPAALCGSVVLESRELQPIDDNFPGRIEGAFGAVNANFQHWMEGDRFSWVGGWPGW
jgi:hypothetical protein